MFFKSIAGLVPKYHKSGRRSKPLPGRVWKNGAVFGLIIVILHITSCAKGWSEKEKGFLSDIFLSIAKKLKHCKVSFFMSKFQMICINHVFLDLFSRVLKDATLSPFLSALKNEWFS